MNAQKPIICINILILKPFLTHLFIYLKKNLYTYTLDFFHVYLIHGQGNDKKIVLKITKDENNYHLCSSHQWPFKTSRHWFKKLITKWKLIQSIIYKRHQVGWHLKYSLKLAFEKKSQKYILFVFLVRKILYVTFLKCFAHALIFHIKTHFFNKFDWSFKFYMTWVTFW